MISRITSRSLAALFLLVSAHGAFAQDELQVKSPNGQIDFRLFLEAPEPGALSRLAYQVFFRGKRLIDRSFLGFDIYTQEPFLGENVGLISSSVSSGNSGFRGLTAKYMQNGSLGRLINLEIRVYDNAVAFRYIIPKSTPLAQILVADELTEFHFAQDGEAYPAQGAVKLSAMNPKALAGFPLIVSQPGAGWVEISDAGAAGYARTSLAHLEGTTLITRLDLSPKEPHLALEQTTPLSCPWRVLTIAGDRESLARAAVTNDLDR
jgi:alpha-glucosidase